MVPEIWSEKEIFVILGHFVALSEKSKFSKNEKKNPGDYHHFTLVYHKRQSYDVWFLRYGAM